MKYYIGRSIRKISKENNKNRVYLDEYMKNGKIKWKELTGKQIKFDYKDVSGFIKVISVVADTQELYVEYKNTVSSILQDSFKKAKIKEVINYNNINRNNFKYKVNDSIKDSKRNLTILDSFYYRTKLYKVRCNICTWDKGIVSERDLLLKQYNCSCCYGRTVVEGINDIPTTAPWMIKYFQGGYDEAKLYTKSSQRKIYFKCPDCEKVKQTATNIHSLFKQKSIGCTCGDGVSYPEKFMSKFLDILNIDYIRQTNNKILPWSNTYKYDFYLPKFNTIIETHGEQHYRTNPNSSFGSVKDIKLNDKKKRDLALKNNIQNYIEVNCQLSELDYIKNSIVQSTLLNVLNINSDVLYKDEVIWEKCNKYATSNLVKLVCEYKDKHSDASTYDIANIFGLDNTTIIKYLHKGNEIGWCIYDPKAALRNGIKKTKSLKYGKLLVYYDTHEYVGAFNTINDFMEFAKSELDVSTTRAPISQVLNHRIESYKGFVFIWEKEAMSHGV